MKRITEERTYKVDMYEAFDGTTFNDENECEKYENSAKCLLQSKYKDLVIARDSEYNLFGVGSEVDDVDIVTLLCERDVDIVMELLGIINPHMLKDSEQDRYNRVKNTIEKAVDTDTPVFILRGYDNECFWVLDNLLDIIDNLVDRCGYKIDYKLIKKGNE